ncbi:MAG: phosphatase PAP2 family protein [Legionella sp.]
MTPWNASPSFHISISWYIFRIMQIYSCSRLLVFLILFYAIALSTVLIRIHYVVDIVFGMLVSELFSNVLLRNLEKYQVFGYLSRKAFLCYYVGTIIILAGRVNQSPGQPPI